MDQTVTAESRGPTSGNLTDPTAPRVRRAIVSGLDTEERLLILLWYAERMSSREIGAVLNLSASRVEERHRAILLKIQASAGARVSPTVHH